MNRKAPTMSQLFDALIAALKSGHVNAAYLDVMDPEPLPPSPPLWTAPTCQP